MAQTKAQLISGASSQSVTFNDATVSSINGGPIGGTRNRIINGDMRIDQRNAGASVTPTDGQYTVDRWKAQVSQASKFTAQQSTDAPTGFVNSLLFTSSSAYSVAAGDYFNISQYIEGVNVSDLGWGTANAKTVTLSFWVKCSLTGTFGGSVCNSANNRSYPFSYTVSAANTWEYKTITISGDTTGTWATDNTSGPQIRWSLGTGSTRLGTAGAWSGSQLFSATGETSLVGANGATLRLAGCQFEAGSVATPFERRSYGQELALCQRYYQLYEGFTGTSFSGSTICIGAAYKTEMRASPSVSATGAIQITNPGVSDYTQSSANVAITSTRISTRGAQLTCANFSGLTNAVGHIHNVGVNSAMIAFSAEL